jgi:hypothetical protein
MLIFFAYVALFSKKAKQKIAEQYGKMREWCTAQICEKRAKLFTVCFPSFSNIPNKTLMTDYLSLTSRAEYRGQLPFTTVGNTTVVSLFILLLFLA